MAVRGTATLFQETLKRAFEGELDLSSDGLALVIVDDTLTPAADDTTPTYSDYVANEVTNAGGYTTTGIPMTTITSAMVAGIYTVGADDVGLLIDASGFINGAWGIICDTTAVGSPALGFIQLDDSSGNPVSEQAGPVDVEWADGVVFEFPANALTWATP